MLKLNVPTYITSYKPISSNTNKYVSLFETYIFINILIQLLTIIVEKIYLSTEKYIRINIYQWCDYGKWLL